MGAPAARALLVVAPAAMRALARLSRRSASTSSTSAAQQAAQQAAAGLPPSAARVLGDAASPLALGVVVDGGRALVARRPILQGDVLLEEWPLAAAPSPERDPAEQCHHCLRLLRPGQGRPAAAPPREPAIKEEEEEGGGGEGDGEAASPAAATTPRAAATAATTAAPSSDDAAALFFCGDACARAAEASYFRVERRVPPGLSPLLREHCARERERFPLVAARLAFAVLQAWEAGGREQELARARAAEAAGRGRRGSGAAAEDEGGGAAGLRRRSWLPALRAVSAPAATGVSGGAGAVVPSSSAAARAGGKFGAGQDEEEEWGGARLDAIAADAAASRLGPMPSVAYLCHANVGGGGSIGSNSGSGNSNAPAAVHLPPAWQRSHALLVRAIGGLLDAEPPPAAARLLPAARAVSSPAWYAAVLSRLHLNSFRVETAATPSLLLAAERGGRGQQDEPSASAAAAADGFAAALLRAAAQPATARALGSAVYSVASLANHSCDPSADAAWPGGDARLRLTARRDIAPGEQVTITYCDASLGVEERRDLLNHAYGFLCNCARCAEEVAALPPDMPPLPR